MKFEWFVVKRLIKKSDFKNNISAPILKIASVAISIGVIMMLIAFATGLGLQNKIRDKIAAFNGHITISEFTSNSTYEDFQPISKNNNFYPDFKSVPSVNHVQATASKYAVIRTEKDFEGVIAKGVGEDYKWSYLEEYLIDGKLPDFSPRFSKEVLISDNLADKLQFAVGDQLIIYFLSNQNTERPRLLALTISGIFDSGFQDFDDQFIFIDINQVQRINKWDDDQVGNFEVFIKDFQSIDKTGKLVYAQIDSFLNAETITEQYPSIFEWLKMFDFNILIIFIVMIAVSGINMITALLVLILERTQMVGIFKALGASNWQIRKMFILQAGYLIIKGLFWGNLIGLTLLLIQKYFGIVQLDQSTYYVSQAPVYLSWDYIIGVNIGVLLSCFLIMIIPSYLIRKITPIQAIKFE
jgi:lipoprotein-releasing system permease protein